MGVRVFVVDSLAETLKVAEARPGSQVLCRLVTSGKGSDWPLSRKYGCSTHESVEILIAAHELGLDAAGLCFHVGSQQRDPEAWAEPIAAAGRIFTLLRNSGLDPRILDLGGGFPGGVRRGLPADRGVRRGRRAAPPPRLRRRPPADDRRAGTRHRRRRRHAGRLGGRGHPARPGPVGVPGRRCLHRTGRDAGRGDPLPPAHHRRRRCHRSLRAGRPDLRQRRRALRGADGRPPAHARRGRRGPAAVRRRLHQLLLQRRLQRLRAPADDDGPRRDRSEP